MVPKHAHRSVSHRAEGVQSGQHTRIIVLGDHGVTYKLAAGVDAAGGAEKSVVTPSNSAALRTPAVNARRQGESETETTKCLSLVCCEGDFAFLLCMEA